MPSLMFLFALTFCETVYIYAIKTLYQRLNDHIKCTKWIVFLKKRPLWKGLLISAYLLGTLLSKEKETLLGIYLDTTDLKVVEDFDQD